MNTQKKYGYRFLTSFLLASAFITLNMAPSFAATAKVKAKSVATKTTDNAVADQSATDNTSEVAIDNNDPLESFNRAIFTFNDKIDMYFMKPVATFYNKIMPKPLNKGIHNFFNNLSELPTVANDLLQFNFYQMGNDIARFGINSTLGIGGLFDMATRMHLPYFQNDFGLTLARWGYQNSSYLVLPFLGSNTIRDGIGIPVDYFEFTVYPSIKPKSSRYEVLGLLYLDTRANLLQLEPVLEEAAVDKYSFMRNAYLQHRAFQIDQVKHLGYAEKASQEPAQEAVVTASAQ